MATSESGIWFKITNKEENHRGFQYQDGLNILIEPFNDDPTATCCAGGLYFSDVENILGFMEYGCHLREIILPTTDPEFKMVMDPQGGKWRANKIILGKKHNLWELSTFQMLDEKGKNIKRFYDDILISASKYGNFETIKYLTENKVTRNIAGGIALVEASQYGHLAIIEYLNESISVDTHKIDMSLCVASAYGHIEIVKYLVEKGADANARNGDALRSASQNGHTEIVKFLTLNGADIHTCCELSLHLACEHGHLKIVRHLVKKGANFHVQNERALREASENGHIRIVRFLVAKGADVDAIDSVTLQTTCENGHNEVVEFLRSQKTLIKNTNQKIENKIIY